MTNRHCIQMVVTPLKVVTVMVLAFCTFSIGPLSIYQVSFHSLLYFQGFALDKLFTVKIEKGK